VQVDHLQQVRLPDVAKVSQMTDQPKMAPEAPVDAPAAQPNAQPAQAKPQTPAQQPANGQPERKKI